MFLFSRCILAVLEFHSKSRHLISVVMISMLEVAHSSPTRAAQPRGGADRSAHAARTMDREIFATIAGGFVERFAALDLFERLAAIRAQIPGRLVFTTSFGLEDQAIAHAIFAQALAIDVATLDTGRLFPETYDVWAQTERRYGVRVLAFAPDHRAIETLIARQGIDGFRSSVEARLDCCTVRKVAPLARALDGSAAWITGLRADQSADRAQVLPALFDEERGLLKVNPLFDWTRERTHEFVRAHDVPRNALHDHGFLSIGCAPCTRAVMPGEPERAGRWWWEQSQKKECGLHVTSDAGAMRANAPQQ
jgi:phosphoadenosine phosphosulfate reductase